MEHAFLCGPRLARPTRFEFFKKHANSGRLIFPTHFPTPTGGTIASDGAKYFSCSTVRAIPLWAGSAVKPVALPPGCAKLST